MTGWKLNGLEVDALLNFLVFVFPIDFAGHRYNSAAATAQPVKLQFLLIIITFKF